MLRITPCFDPAVPSLKLRLEGKLLGDWVTELRSCCTQSPVLPHHLHLDLAGVSYADAEGAALLLELSRSGARLDPCSSFIQALLTTEHP